MTQPAPNLPGFRFERVLGSGGYSDVFLYQQQLPSRPVAVKVLKAVGLGEAQRARFTAEANSMAGLADHPFIVPVFEAAVSADGRPYLVMQYYSRPNLSVRAASERLGVAEVLRVGIQIASAVETAHRAGILHRDIKPANLLINQYGAPGLADFGIAGQMADLDDDEDTGVSVPWSPPEVLYATAPTSVRSDVYSLAATLWHLLVGRSPFEARGGDNSTFALMRRIRDDTPPPTGRPDVPDALDRVLRQAMSKEPRNRPASAIEFARRLQAVEQQMQLDRTDIVVTDVGGGGAAATAPPEHYSTAPSTVARPLAVSPQTPLSYRPADPGDAAHAPPTDLRPDAFAAQSGRRPSALREDTGTTPSRRGRGALAAIVVGIVGVAAAVVVAITAGGSDGPPTPRGTVSQTEGTQNPGIPGQNYPPGKVTVVGKRSSGGTISFTWTYDAALKNDSFAWREVGGQRRSGTVDAPKLRLRAARGGETCIQVRVVRADGSNASAVYSDKGCS